MMQPVPDQDEDNDPRAGEAFVLAFLCAALRSGLGVVDTGAAWPIADPHCPHVWLVDETAENFLGVDSAAPMPEDLGRVESMRDGPARRLFLARRTALRRILSTYLGRAKGQIHLLTAPGGKLVLRPAAQDPAVAFSMAHSGGFLAIGIGAASSLGIDIEVEGACAAAQDIAARWFRPEERAALAALPAEGQGHGFLRLWTAKEALAKRHGAGLRLMRAGAPELGVASEWQAGRLVLFRAGPAHIGALAMSGPIHDVSIKTPPVAHCAE